MDIRAILFHQRSTVLIQDVLYVFLSLYLKCGAKCKLQHKRKIYCKILFDLVTGGPSISFLLCVILASCYSLLCKSLSVAGLSSQLWDFPKKWE